MCIVQLFTVTMKEKTKAVSTISGCRENKKWLYPIGADPKAHCRSYDQRIKVKKSVLVSFNLGQGYCWLMCLELNISSLFPLGKLEV